MGIVDEIDENEKKHNVKQKNESNVDEIEENEKKYDMNAKNEENVDWNEIINALKQKNTNYIKTLISSKEIGVNSKNPTNGQTLLIYAVIIGNFDLVKAICNFGADVSIKDEEGLDALDYALKFGQYKITEIIFYRSLSGKTGNDLKRISTEIHTKNKEAQYIQNSNNGKAMMSNIKTFIIQAIKERAPFDPSMLFYAWQFNQNSLSSPLWTVMMETYEQILSDTKDKNGWKWLKEQFINSSIWFLPAPDPQQAHKKPVEHILFEYKDDFDTNGIFYALGTNFGQKQYENPAKTGKVKLKSTAMYVDLGSEANYTLIGRSESRTFTKEKKNSFFSVDFGKYGMKPTHYTLRHYKSKEENHLRNWEFQGSNDGEHWNCLRKHIDDNSLNGASKSHTWTIDTTDEYFSHFRVIMTGPNQGHNWSLVCSGMEIYGDWCKLTEE